MLRRQLSVFVLVAAAITGCQGESSVEPSAAIPGAWQCDDGIVLTIKPEGKYEWRVPAGESGQVGFAETGSEHHRVEADGGYSLLGSWRLKGSTLELDMLGDTDIYRVEFASANSVSLAGPESYSCTRA